MPWRSSSPRVCRVSSASTTSAARSSSRTRRVTSARFPIGVAQTASGIAASSSSVNVAARQGRRETRQLKLSERPRTQPRAALQPPGTRRIFAEGALERLERDQARADHAGGVELRTGDLERLTRRRERLLEDAEPGRRHKLVEGCRPEAAADHDARRSEDVDERADADPEQVTDVAERGMLRFHEIMSGCVRPEQL